MTKNKQGAKASDKCGVFTLGIQEKKKIVNDSYFGLLYNIVIL